MNAAAMKSRHGARRRRAGNEQYFGNTVQLRLGWPRSVPMSAQQRKFNATKPALYRLDVPVMSDDLRAERHGMPLQQPVCITMTHRPYTPPAWQSKPLADGRVTLLVVPLKVEWDPGANKDFTGWRPERLFQRRWGLIGGFGAGADILTPYAPGDLIWCRETWAAWDGCPPAVFKATDDVDPYGGWKSPITMPKWAARTWLRCTGVEVRRVQTISEDEAHRAGYEFTGMSPTGDDYLGSAICGPWGFAEGFPNYYADPWCAFVAVEKISKEDV